MPPVNYAVAENLIEMGRRLARCPQQRNLGSSAKLDRSCRLGTVSKIRGIMYRIYKFGVLHERVDKNPVEHVETRSLSLYKALLITPQQTLAILNRLSNPLHFTLVLTCAATALRASEIVSQRWSDILWSDRQIRISKRWAKGADGDTKTAASNGYVPLHPVLAEYLKHWRTQTPHSKVDDFVFPSLLRFGRVPISASIFVADYLRPAATGAGVNLAKGQRFGFHNLRHSLSNWLVIDILPFLKD